MGCVSPNKAQSTKNFIVDLKFKINYSRKKIIYIVKNIAVIK